MPRLELIPALAPEIQSLHHVWSIVYRRGDPYQPEEGPQPEDAEWGVEARLDGELAGAFWSTKLDLRFEDGFVPGMGVGAVAVLPPFRGQKVADEMMRWGLAEADRRGDVIAALYAYRESYYRRFGYEVVGQRLKIRCPQNRFPSLKPDLPIRQLKGEDVHLLAPCFAEFTNRLHGAHRRTARDWQHRLGKRTPMIFAVGDPVEGYCWTQMEGNFWEELLFGEVVWSTERGYRNVLAVMRGVAENRSGLVWDEPACSPFLTHFMDQGIQVELHRHVMWRIVSLPKFLERSTAPRPEVDLVVRVTDPAFPPNDRVWRLVGGTDGVRAEPSDAPPKIELTIGKLTQMALGDPSAAAMRDAEWLEDSAEALIALFPQRTVYLTEFF